MTNNKVNKLELTPELENYFDAINLHMQVHNKPHLLSSKSTQSPKTKFPSLPGTSSSSSVPSIQVDDAQLEARLVSEMMEQVRLIEQALLNFGEHADPKKIELGHDVQNSFNELWSENLSVVVKAIEFLKAIFKDVHRYWPYLEGQMDRLVMACARVIGLMFTRYKSSLFVNAHDATRAPIINLLNSTAQLFHSIILKSPLLPSKISSETYSALFTSLMPYYLLSEEESKNLDPLVESKIQSFITNMLSMSDLNNLLLALLRIINTKLVEYNQEPSKKAKQMNILIKWMQKLGSYLNDSKVTNLNLDLILNEADMLIREYPGSVYENSRDYSLLETIREIVFKIVEYKGDPGIWDHLMMVDLDKGDSGLIKYINIALERHQVFQVLESNTSKSELLNTNNSAIKVPNLKKLFLHNYKPTIPNGVELSVQKEDESLDPEVVMFLHWLNNLASTSELLQAKISLDYLNQNFDDLVSKFAPALEPRMDFLIRACTRQYHLFTTLYYPPNVCQASSESLQMLHSTTSLLKRIFTSTISLSSATSQTISQLILLIFSLRLPWSTDFSVESLAQLESSILTNESLDKSELICICIRVMRFEQTYTNNQKYSTFGDIQRFARQMLTELTIPLQFVTSSMLTEQYDLNAILYEINAYLRTICHRELQESFDRFTKNVDHFESRIEDSRPLSIIEKLIYDIVRLRGHFIHDNLKSLSASYKYPSSCISGQLQDFIQKLIGLGAKQKLDYYGVVPSTSSSQSEENKEKEEGDEEKGYKFYRTQASEMLNEIQTTFLPSIRSPILVLNQNIFCTKLQTLAYYYDCFTRYPILILPAIESLSEVCTCAMVQFRMCGTYTAETLYGRIGELVLKMYRNPDSLGHEYVTKITLGKLIEANIGMLLEHANKPKKQLKSHFHWIWQLQCALTNYSKPYYLLSPSLCLIETTGLVTRLWQCFLSVDCQLALLLDD